MRIFLLILALAAVLALIASLAVAILFSIDAGRAAWVLTAVLVLDSLGLFAIGAWVILRGCRRTRSFSSHAVDRGG